MVDEATSHKHKIQQLYTCAHYVYRHLLKERILTIEDHHCHEQKTPYQTLFYHFSTTLKSMPITVGQSNNELRQSTFCNDVHFLAYKVNLVLVAAM